MDVLNRVVRPVEAPAGEAPRPAAHKKSKGSGWLKVLTLALLIFGALLVASLSVYTALGGHKEEASYVNKDRYQAVFLNGGQVYFGKIGALNNNLLTLSNVYFLQVKSSDTSAAATASTNSSDITLAKLGCQQLHDPVDQMIINRAQVSFWENLNDDGQVVKAIKTFLKDNPNGQVCKATDTTTDAKQ